MMGWFSKKEGKKDYVKELRNLIHKGNKEWGLNILITHAGPYNSDNTFYHAVAQIKNTVTESIKFLGQCLIYDKDCSLYRINELCEGVLKDIKKQQESSGISAAIEKVGFSWSRVEKAEPVAPVISGIGADANIAMTKPMRKKRVTAKRKKR